MVIETDRLILREMTEDDFDALYVILAFACSDGIISVSLRIRDCLLRTIYLEVSVLIHSPEMASNTIQ